MSQPGPDERQPGDLPADGSPPARPEEALVVGRRRAHRMAWLYTAAAVILLPWIVYLAVTLPSRNLDRHYRAAWVGFDVFLVVVIVRTAYMAFRVDQRVQFAATATATLLFVDAWFDVMTSNGRGQVLEALILAVGIEIPAAIFSLYLARQVNRRVLEVAHLEGTPLEESAARQRSHRRRAPRRQPAE